MATFGGGGNIVVMVAIAGFETLALLGSGQYGDVYLVRRTCDGQLFAAKVAHRHRVAGGDLQQLLHQEQQEAELLRRLNHPNITRCVDVVKGDEEFQQPVIIMEYASGGDLDAYLRSCQDRCAHLDDLSAFSNLQRHSRLGVCAQRREHERSRNCAHLRPDRARARVSARQPDPPSVRASNSV